MWLDVGEEVALITMKDNKRSYSLEGSRVSYILMWAETLPWRTREVTGDRVEQGIGREFEITMGYRYSLTPSLNLNYPRFRFLLNSSNGLAGNAFVKPSAT